MIQFDEEKENKKLDELRKHEEEELIQVLAASKYHIPSVDLAPVPIDNDALRVITEEDARKIGVAPFKILGKVIDIAVRAPDSGDVQVLFESLKERGYTPRMYMASLQSLEKVWTRYKELSYATQTRAGGLDVSGAVISEIGDRIKMISDIKGVIEQSMEETKTHKISHMLEIILAGAISLNASDIHIEPGESIVDVRLRLDGVLQDTMNLTFDVYKLLNSRIKLLSGLKLTSHIAQDGRFSIFIQEQEISIRTSLIPGAYGESIVLRILNPKSIQVKLEDMGIEPKLFSVIEKEIAKPNGLILLTGPTGSGKTTTLYAFLRRIYSTEIKIITIEDPIEYHLAGITQTQTEEEKGYTFLEGLRSALRQDPDVMMVGEIRDGETAKIAIESALTGHMVFSTLHTNNAAGVIPRLVDLGVNPKIISSALTLSIAQRLVRKLCQTCKKESVISEEDTKQMEFILNQARTDGKDIVSYGIKEGEPFKLYAAVGCEKCNMTGYKGRMGIFEAIKSDAAIEAIIPNNPSEREIKQVARKQGILNMQEDGVIKALLGVTSLEEVKSVVDLDQE